MSAVVKLRHVCPNGLCPFYPPVPEATGMPDARFPVRPSGFQSVSGEITKAATRHITHKLKLSCAANRRHLLSNREEHDGKYRGRGDWRNSAHRVRTTLDRVIMPPVIIVPPDYLS